MAATDDTRRRIDKWLWFARLARTRTAAQKLAVSGRVRVNRVKNTSASRTVRVDDVLTIALDHGVRVLRIKDLGERRGPASAAQLLYVDLAPLEPRLRTPVAQRIGRRPTKRDRRVLDAARDSMAEKDDFSPSGS